ncbi:hypothetical protein AKJ38_02275 [candidate division MSBL1 archaeon SCGC-AAA259I14]|uniref:Uncharacterized protein n=1 Tax=candidate division MSBL1 archaeon SCGC-AAA259I14 TaxID=1698268 RepID=A0A133URT3_9EURY|nr:hypothetical protein AKJ38_02275 [candidate division MSBL1 archaeon SCGC-AAA259I14]
MRKSGALTVVTTGATPPKETPSRSRRLEFPGCSAAGAAGTSRSENLRVRGFRNQILEGVGTTDEDFEKDVAGALIDGEEKIRGILRENGWDTAYVDLKITAFIKTSDFERYKRVEFENETEKTVDE